jgi:hypothetical protein
MNIMDLANHPILVPPGEALTQQQLLAAIVGVALLLLCLLMGWMILSFGAQGRPIHPGALQIFRIVLALGVSAVAVLLTGDLEINGQKAGLGIRAGGALAVFVLVYLVNPPGLLRPGSKDQDRKPDDT